MTEGNICVTLTPSSTRGNSYSDLLPPQRSSAHSDLHAYKWNHAPRPFPVRLIALSIPGLNTKMHPHSSFRAWHRGTHQAWRLKQEDHLGPGAPGKLGQHNEIYVLFFFFLKKKERKTRSSLSHAGNSTSLSSFLALPLYKYRESLEIPVSDRYNPHWDSEARVLNELLEPGCLPCVYGTDSSFCPWASTASVPAL